MLRQPMGASDFALSEYSYDDVPVGQTDPELKKFSLDHDRADILPVLKEFWPSIPNKNHRVSVECARMDEKLQAR